MDPTGSIFQTKRIIAKPMICEEIRPRASLRAVDEAAAAVLSSSRLVLPVQA